jgi:hypothetical protein
MLARLNGRFLVLTPRQVANALERKAQLEKWADTVRRDIQSLHPQLGQASNQFAGWQGKRKTLIQYGR